MKPKNRPNKAVAKAVSVEMTDKAGEAKHTRHGPEPERFKITGYANWEDAVKVALRKPKPPGGWLRR